MTELTAYHLPGDWGLVSVSPFCLKLDAFLRIADIPHLSVTVAAPFAGPKKKAPWIEHEQRKIGDSSFIIEYLIEKFGVDPNAHLTPAERGQAVAMQRLVEENLYWAMVYDRWVRDENWPILKGSLLGRIPAPIRAIIAPMARRGVRQQLKGHGLGLHSEREIEAIARRDIGALAAILGDRHWFFGSAPSLADATVFSLLANIRYPAFTSPMKAMIAEQPQLAAFVDRFRDHFYPSKTGEEDAV
jgi:glutathione S-transferase